MMIEQEPMAWAVMQPDSYRVFVSYNEALIHQESCAGGNIVPLYTRSSIIDENTEIQDWPTLKDSESGEIVAYYNPKFISFPKEKNYINEH